MLRGLTQPRPAALPGLGILEQRLNAAGGTPVALALSGGGDSMALLHVAAAWAAKAGRPLLALTVDHGLQPEGADWARFAADRARRLGAAHRTLHWRGEKPARGLPAAARTARHALLADAAREAGSHVLLMGHTADDLMEAEEMRRSGASVPSPAIWSPSPAWPQGRGLFLLRPLLGCRRAALRDRLRGLGESWIEDPANDDLRFARAAARHALAGAGCATRRSEPPPIDISDAHEGQGGELRAPRALFAMLDPADGRRLLGALALCAAGTTRPPGRASLEALLGRLTSGEASVASLAGARIAARGGEAIFSREAGETARGGLAEMALPLGESVFDGRFELTTTEPGCRVRALRGLARRLPEAERAQLSAVDPAARGALPAVISPSGAAGCPILAQGGSVSARPLARVRLAAALGGFPDEAALWRVAKPHAGA